MLLGWQSYQTTSVPASSDRLLQTRNSSQLQGLFAACVFQAHHLQLAGFLALHHIGVTEEYAWREFNHHTKIMEICKWVMSWYLCMCPEIAQVGKLPQLNRRHKDNRLGRQREDYLNISKKKKKKKIQGYELAKKLQTNFTERVELGVQQQTTSEVPMGMLLINKRSKEIWDQSVGTRCFCSTSASLTFHS